ncbi:low molecular weight phosphatase family protein [Candidatus Chloroploca sp. Khr17]|uniref:arsenate-mycothiol transferase ArsC n=1 Tax=Candidatus Chloroploca sp. Khr17 TaxID=2496869 RepID=UPI00101DD63F|nr:low molecular weight phosphatase family protein [Candidatus Chloroploca sp. Khr17]
MQTLLFLCTGNYYRSRFAAYLFNARAQALGLPWTAFSRALALERGSGNVGPISPLALDGLAQRGVTVTPPIPVPTQASEEDFARAHRRIALYEREHQPLIIERFPAWTERVTYWHVADVGDVTPEDALAAIEREVTALLSREHLLVSGGVSASEFLDDLG